MLDLIKQIRPRDEAFVAQLRDESELLQYFTFFNTLYVAPAELVDLGKPLRSF
jgi:hypothetical protein